VCILSVGADRIETRLPEEGVQKSTKAMSRHSQLAGELHVEGNEWIINNLSHNLLVLKEHC